MLPQKISEYTKLSKSMVLNPKDGSCSTDNSKIFLSIDRSSAPLDVCGGLDILFPNACPPCNHCKHML